MRLADWRIWQINHLMSTAEQVEAMFLVLESKVAVKQKFTPAKVKEMQHFLLEI